MISFWGSSELVIERNENDRNVCPEGLFTPIGIGCTDFKFSKKSLDFSDFFGCFTFLRILLGFFPDFFWVYEDFINKKGFKQ